MPYAQRRCADCREPFTPRGPGRKDVCWSCETRRRAEAKRAADTWSAEMARSVAQREDAAYVAPALEASRVCEVDGKKFVPPVKDPGQKRCAECRRLAERAPAANPFEDWRPGQPVPKAPSHLAAPLRQAVFDLETFSLDRGWGVLMVGSILLYGNGGEPEQYTFDLRDTQAWKEGRRSDDSELGARILKVLNEAHILIAHNGLNFDIPYLNSVALKYGMPRLSKKLIDPVQIARQKYRIGSNALGSLTSFLGLPEDKMPVSSDVWRTALFDGNEASWRTLRERCESDVRILAMVAGRITDDVGMVDKIGSFRG